MVEMHISEIGLCSGHSASGVWVNENAATTVPGLFAAGDLACVPHNYMLGAFVYGKLAGTAAAAHASEHEHAVIDEPQIARERERVLAPMANERGLPPAQVEYKLRRMVNDYLQPPKVTRKMLLGLERFEEIRADLPHLHARNPHELMRAMEIHAILDCAEMAARASLYRTESRWGLYHACVDHPERNDTDWLVHVQLAKNSSGEMHCFKRALEPYVIDIDDEQKSAYQHMRVNKAEVAAA
jgi:succinate dehydrogenase/fumarate reductase flavoprotein subunit